MDPHLAVPQLLVAQTPKVTVLVEYFVIGVCSMHILLE